MYEEVCLLCSKPLTADGRAYCSDECESLDASSPSASATSSAFASPYLPSANTPGSLGDVPALVPSALGRALNPRAALLTSKNRLSLSSSSTSSLAWDAFSDADDGAYIRNGGADEDFPELPAPDAKGAHLAALVYARRPSATNNRSNVPLLHRRTSSISSPFASDAQAPAAPEDDFFDAPSASLSSASSHERQPSRAGEPETITAKAKRNRASLPAYFSLLTSTSPASPRAARLPSSVATLTAVSRSLQSSPPTPRIAHPLVDAAVVYAQHQRQLTLDATPRGRDRRPRSPSPATRARLDSVEKVAGWVSRSPAVGARGRTLTRRNSSPPARPLAALFDAPPEDPLEHLREALARSLHVRDGQEQYRDRRDREREERRGRRRMEELDGERGAPGYGNGRSGLRARERERERGRPLAAR